MGGSLPPGIDPLFRLAVLATNQTRLPNTVSEESWHTQTIDARAHRRAEERRASEQQSMWGYAAPFFVMVTISPTRNRSSSVS